MLASLACSTTEPPTSARVALPGTSWVLARFQSMDDTVLLPDSAARYELAFGADGSLTVRADCNRGRASWESPDSVSLTIGPVALTRMACPPSRLTDRFARDLGYVRSYIVRDGRLHLALMADGGIYTFEPATTSQPDVR